MRITGPGPPAFRIVQTKINKGSAGRAFRKPTVLGAGIGSGSPTLSWPVGPSEGTQPGVGARVDTVESKPRSTLGGRRLCGLAGLELDEHMLSHPQHLLSPRG